MKLDLAIDGIGTRLAAREAERARERAIHEALATLADLARQRGGTGEATPPQSTAEAPDSSGIGTTEPTPPRS